MFDWHSLILPVVLLAIPVIFWLVSLVRKSNGSQKKEDQK